MDKILILISFLLILFIYNHINIEYYLNYSNLNEKKTKNVKKNTINNDIHYLPPANSYLNLYLDYKVTDTSNLRLL